MNHRKLLFIKQYYSHFKGDLNLASKVLGISDRQLRRYISDDPKQIPPQTICNFMDYLYRGLPKGNGWSDLYIDSNGVLHAPEGKATAGEIANLFRWKWCAHRSSQSLKEIRKEMQSSISVDYVQDMLLDMISTLHEEVKNKRA